MFCIISTFLFREGLSFVSNSDNSALVQLHGGGMETERKMGGRGIRSRHMVLLSRFKGILNTGLQCYFRTRVTYCFSSAPAAENRQIALGKADIVIYGPAFRILSVINKTFSRNMCSEKHACD